MIEGFSVEEPLFEGQFHERQQFKLVIGGEEYKGFLLEGEITWYQPQPNEEVDKGRLMEVESEVNILMQKFIQ